MIEQGSLMEAEQIVDTAAKAKLLSLETNAGSVALSSVSSIDFYGPGSLGLRLAEKQGEIVPSLLVNSKRLRPSGQFLGAQQVIDRALEEFEHNEAAS
jgi:hypothetical protein